MSRTGHESHLFGCPDRWEVLPTIWPYKPGYGLYNPARNMVLDTGLTRDEADRRCIEENVKLEAL